MAETGHLGDPRCADALAMLDAKRLPDGGFPREDRSATRRSRVASRGTWADWGPPGPGPATRSSARPRSACCGSRPWRAPEGSSPPGEPAVAPRQLIRYATVTDRKSCWDVGSIGPGTGTGAMFGAPPCTTPGVAPAAPAAMGTA